MKQKILVFLLHQNILKIREKQIRQIENYGKIDKTRQIKNVIVIEIHLIFEFISFLYLHFIMCHRKKLLFISQMIFIY